MNGGCYGEMYCQHVKNEGRTKETGAHLEQNISKHRPGYRSQDAYSLPRVVAVICEGESLAEHICNVLHTPFYSGNSFSKPDVLECGDSCRAKASSPLGDFLCALIGVKSEGQLI